MFILWLLQGGDPHKKLLQKAEMRWLMTLEIRALFNI